MSLRKALHGESGRICLLWSAGEKQESMDPSRYYTNVGY
jgi:hypothetical protein